MISDKLIEECYKKLHPNYQFNDTYKLTFLSKKQYSVVSDSLSNLRKYFNQETYWTLKHMFLHYYKNSLKIQILDSQQLRLIAQNLIRKRNIRHFIFKKR